MVKTASTMLELGSAAPDFTLPNVDGSDVSRDDFTGRPLLMAFICTHCPFVVHIEPGLIALGSDYRDSGIGIVAISSNDAVSYPADSPQRMGEKEYPFPYLYDESQAVARAYDAACTPDLFLFDAAGGCVYRGQFDDARPGNSLPVNGASIRAAMDALLDGAPPLAEQKPSMGCSIKWR